MLRKSAKTEYWEKGTILALRIQFYAVDIARNKAGLNDWIYEQARDGAEKERKEKEEKSKSRENGIWDHHDHRRALASISQPKGLQRSSCPYTMSSPISICRNRISSRSS